MCTCHSAMLLSQLKRAGQFCRTAGQDIHPQQCQEKQPAGSNCCLPQRKNSQAYAEVSKYTPSLTGSMYSYKPRNSSYVWDCVEKLKHRPGYILKFYHHDGGIFASGWLPQAILPIYTDIFLCSLLSKINGQLTHMNHPIVSYYPVMIAGA